MQPVNNVFLTSIFRARGLCSQAIKKNNNNNNNAVGYTLRRIAAKCANSYATNQLAGYFSPIQLEVGTPGGSEAAVHATRRSIEAMPDGHVVAKLDF